MHANSEKDNKNPEKAFGHFYKKRNFETKTAVKNQAPDEIFLTSPLEIFNTTYARNPRAIPLAIEKVRGIITIITKAGKSSVESDQLSFSMPLIIRIET